jgi:hypothetical protein
MNYGDTDMSQRIDQFCEDLRTKLTNIDNRFNGLQSKIDGKAQDAEREVRSQFDDVRRRVEQDRAKVSAAQTRVKDWANTRKIATADKIAEWKARRETTRLQKRAEEAERYAAAALDVALADVDEAEQAALEAWLARQDATAAATP